MGQAVSASKCQPDSAKKCQPKRTSWTFKFKSRSLALIALALLRHILEVIKLERVAGIITDPPCANSPPNNVEHCGSPAGSSGYQALDPGALCLLRQDGPLKPSFVPFSFPSYRNRVSMIITVSKMKWIETN